MKQSSKYVNWRSWVAAGTGFRVGFVIAALVITSYGAVWTRGGYADDFALLIRSAASPYFDVVLGWITTFNSRLAQALLLPLFMKVLAEPNAAGFHWIYFHIAGVATLLVTVLIFNNILKLFDVALHARIIACLVFALHPVKTEVIFWPELIVIAALIAVFLFGVWLYLRDAKDGRETIPRLTVFALVSVFAASSLEQLIPLVFLVVVVRLLMFPSTRHMVSANLLVLFSVLSICAGLIVLGASADRFERFSSPDEAFFLKKIHVFDVLLTSLSRVILQPISILLDRYYWSELFAAVTGPEFLVSLGLLVYLYFLLNRQSIDDEGAAETHRRNVVALLVTGVVIWILALTPFMVITYDFGNRMVYVPLIGLSLVGAAVFTLALQSCRFQWHRGVLNGALVTILGSFVAVNIFTQNHFEKIWRDEQMIIEALSGLASTIEDDVEVNLLNLPVRHGPSPDVQIHGLYIFNNIVNWVLPGKNLTGNSLRQFSEIFQVSERDSHQDGSNVYLAQDGHAVLLWTVKRVVHVTGLNMRESCDADMDETDQSSLPSSNNLGGQEQILSACMIDIQMTGAYDEAYKVRAEDLVVLEGPDVGVLRLAVIGDDILDSNYTLIVHSHRGDRSVPHDRVITGRTFVGSESSGYRTDIVIDGISQVDLLRISLSKNEQRVRMKPVLNGTRQLLASPGGVDQVNIKLEFL